MVYAFFTAKYVDLWLIFLYAGLVIFFDNLPLQDYKKRGAALRPLELARAERTRSKPVKCSRQIPDRHLQHILPALADLVDDRRFKTAMHHALGAAGILPYPVLLPVGLRHHLRKGRIVGVCDQVAWSLPAARVAGRIAPGGAFQLLFPLEKAQIHRG